MNITVESRVKKVIAKKLEIDPETITDESRFVEDLGMDSLAMVEVMMNFEEEFKEFNIEIPDNAAEKIKTVGDVTVYIAEMVNEES